MSSVFVGNIAYSSNTDLNSSRVINPFSLRSKALNASCTLNKGLLYNFYLRLSAATSPFIIKFNTFFKHLLVSKSN